MNDLPELLPCPFCGEEPAFANVPGAPELYCEDCGIPTVDGDTIEEIYASWNTRHEAREDRRQGVDEAELDANKSTLTKLIAERDAARREADRWKTEANYQKSERRKLASHSTTKPVKDDSHE